MTTPTYTIQFRHDTAANWITVNPVLGVDEPGAETDTGKWKLGDGTTVWTSLPYVGLAAVTAAVAVETTRAQAAEALLAPLNSPALTGTPTVPTAAPLTNNNQDADTAYVDAAVAVEKARAIGAEASNAIFQTVTTINGVTQGHAYWSQPLRGAGLNKVVVYLNAYQNTTSTPQTITYPVAFGFTPETVSDSIPTGWTATTTTLTLPVSMSAPLTGWLIVEGF